MNTWESIGALGICLALVACIDSSEATDDIEGITNQDEVVQIHQFPHQLSLQRDTAIFSIKTVYQLEKKAKNHTQKDITKIVFSYPVIDSFSNPIVKDSINSIISNLLLQDVTGQVVYDGVDKRMVEFLEEYQSHKKEMKEFGLPSSYWVFEMTIDILLNTSHFMTLRVHQLEFTGGAHANSWTNYLNLDLNIGRLITLDQLFVQGYENTLLEIGETVFKSANNVKQDTSLSDTNYEFEAGGFMLPSNFSIGQDGLHFYYNPYDLGPFALGEVSFKIPYQALLSIIDTSMLPLDPIKD